MRTLTPAEPAVTLVSVGVRMPTYHIIFNNHLVYQGFLHTFKHTTVPCDDLHGMARSADWDGAAPAVFASGAPQLEGRCGVSQKVRHLLEARDGSRSSVLEFLDASDGHPADAAVFQTLPKSIHKD